MRLLLDTHLLIWAAQGVANLPAKAVPILSDRSNALMFSVVSLWEIVIKTGLNRSNFSYGARDIRRQLLDRGYQELDVTGEHVLAVGDLPGIHHDPFDRLLIAQARVESLPLLTADKVVASYPGTRFVG